ncbi:MAG: hydroxymethylbilane synthase [Planctomycetota bacterium]
MTTLLRLATRRSPLALWQARHAAKVLRQRHPGLRIVLVPVLSGGDIDTFTPLHALGSVGVFCKEVHALVLSGQADVGVHSLKDLPTSPPDGMTLTALLPRVDPRDTLIGTRSLESLPHGALIGTSSTRRRAQLASLRPDLRFTDLRGNVQTRLAKIARGDAAATCMAVAGLRRLGLSTPHASATLNPWTTCTPAPGQGAVALDCRSADSRTRRLLACVSHHETATAIGIERTVLAGLAGGCSLPLGCLVQRINGSWHGVARLGMPNGELRSLRVTGPAYALAQRILDVLAKP